MSISCAARVAVVPVRRARVAGNTRGVAAAAGLGGFRRAIPHRRNVVPSASSEDADGFGDTEDELVEDEDVTEDAPYALRFTSLSGEDLQGAIGALKAVDLKSELKFFGANTKGVKSQLSERLMTCYALQAEGKDVKAALRELTLTKLAEVNEETESANARRAARRKTKGGYLNDHADAATPLLRRSRGKGIPIVDSLAKARDGSASGKPLKYIEDVDLSEGETPKGDRYKVDNPVTGRRKLNVVRRDLDRQTNFQDQMTEHGWYMISVPETREEKTAVLICALSGTPKIGGVTIESWVPRQPGGGFCVSESTAHACVDKFDLLRLVPPTQEDPTTEMNFPGFILVKFSEMNQVVLNALEEIYQFKGFAVGGITRYGATRKQKSEAPRTVPTAQLDAMVGACLPRVVSDEEFEAIELEKKRKKKEQDARLALAQAMAVAGVTEEDLTSLRAAAGEDVFATERESSVSDESTSERPQTNDPKTKPPGGATRVDVKEGPFKGFKGFVTATNEDGSVDALLQIFGRETAVTLQPDEFS
tara:strand:- start:178 stop:1782 length:1605 start_codon:yes stop_codon:yes gene_type:complete